MDSLVIADADENDEVRKLRITLSTAFEDAGSPMVRCFINKLKYGTIYSDFIERRIKKLEQEFAKSTWTELQDNYKENADTINEEIGKTDQIIEELVDINIRESKENEEGLPEFPTITPKVKAPTEERKETEISVSKGKRELSKETEQESESEELEEEGRFSDSEEEPESEEPESEKEESEESEENEGNEEESNEETE
jgi:hypothetical protein